MRNLVPAGHVKSVASFAAESNSVPIPVSGQPGDNQPGLSFRVDAEREKKKNRAGRLEGEVPVLQPVVGRFFSQQGSAASQQGSAAANQIVR
jgi:hypothetical protein